MLVYLVLWIAIGLLLAEVTNAFLRKSKRAMLPFMGYAIVVALWPLIVLVAIIKGIKDGQIG